MSKWQQRWFVLAANGKTLAWYETKEKYLNGMDPLKSVDISDITKVEVDSAEKDCFNMVADRTYKLLADDNADAKQWVKAISRCIRKLKSSKSPKPESFADQFA